MLKNTQYNYVTEGFFSMSQFYNMELNLELEKNLNKNNKQHKKYL